MKAAIRNHMAKLSLKAEFLREFWRDRNGLGAIEFAIITPLLIVAYIGSFEVSVGYSVSRKVARAASSVADILTQQTEVSHASLDGMPMVVKSIMTPFEPKANTNLRITGIRVTAPGVGVVAWSRGWTNPWNDKNIPPTASTPYQVGATITLPADLSSTNAFIVRSELDVPHDLLLFAPALAGSVIDHITLSKTSYYRQRVGAVIKCSDC